MGDDQRDYSDYEEDANEEEDWLGEENPDEQILAKRERELQNAANEFVEDIKAENDLKEFIRMDDDDGDDFEVIKERAKSIVYTLADLKTRGDKSLSRQDYVHKLKDDLCTLFGYDPWLLDQLVSLVPVSEWISFIEANEQPRPVVIRTNTLKTSRKALVKALTDRGVHLEPIGPWSKLGLVVYDSQVPVGATPEYLAGHYMLQSPSSFLPVMALNPTEGSRVLDMCAAPGGKTTHMAMCMKNKGVLVANDYNTDRCAGLIANIHRLGITNTIVVNYDGCAFPELMGGFNYVLCDAPCTGTGVISRDPSVKTTKNEIDLRSITKKQKELILSACDSVAREGGRMCYCTCSVLVQENEAVVDYLLKRRRCKVIPPGLDPEFDSELTPGLTRYKEMQFHPSLANTRRVYPHKLNMDGFYFALIEVAPGPNRVIEDAPEEQDKEAPKESSGKKKRNHQRKFSKRFGGK